MSFKEGANVITGMGLDIVTVSSTGWEFDWNRIAIKRRVYRGVERGVERGWRYLVMGRNPNSRSVSAHSWHYLEIKNLQAGVHGSTRPALTTKQIGEYCGLSTIKAARPLPGGRRLNRAGYVEVPLSRVTEDDRLLIIQSGFHHQKNLIMEHRLVALRKYGKLPRGMLVRHRNGRKTDNRPENLIVGTTRDNTADHVELVRLAWYWRERALAAEGVNVVDYLTQRDAEPEPMAAD